MKRRTVTLLACTLVSGCISPLRSGTDDGTQSNESSDEPSNESTDGFAESLGSDDWSQRGGGSSNRFSGRLDGDLADEAVGIASWNADERTFPDPPVTSTDWALWVASSGDAVLIDPDGETAIPFDVDARDVGWVGEDLVVAESDRVVRIDRSELVDAAEVSEDEGPIEVGDPSADEESASVASWSTDVTGPCESITVSADRVLARTDLGDGAVTLLDAEDGTTLETTTVDGIVASAALDDRTGYLLTDDGSVLSIDETGTDELGERAIHGRQLAIDGETVYVVGEGESGLLVALDAETGAEQWRYEGDVGSWGISVDDTTVFATKDDGDLLALRDGEELWTYAAETSFEGHAGSDHGPVSSADCVAYVDPSSAIVLLGREDGSERNRYEWDPVAPNRPIVAGDGVVLSDRVGLSWLPVHEAG